MMKDILKKEDIRLLMKIIPSLMWSWGTDMIIDNAEFLFYLYVYICA